MLDQLSISMDFMDNLLESSCKDLLSTLNYLPPFVCHSNDSLLEGGTKSARLQPAIGVFTEIDHPVRCLPSLFD